MHPKELSTGWVIRMTKWPEDHWSKKDYGIRTFVDEYVLRDDFGALCCSPMKGDAHDGTDGGAPNMLSKDDPFRLAFITALESGDKKIVWENYINPSREHEFATFEAEFVDVN